MVKQILRYSTFVGSIVLLCSCTTVEQAPTGLVSSAEASIRQAESLGASEHAPVALNDARKHLRDAREAMNDEKYREARLLLEKAIIDADYAGVKSNAEEAQLAAQTIEQNLQSLEEESRY